MGVIVKGSARSAAPSISATPKMGARAAVVPTASPLARKTLVASGAGGGSAGSAGSNVMSATSKPRGFTVGGEAGFELHRAVRRGPPELQHDQASTRCADPQARPACHRDPEHAQDLGARTEQRRLVKRRYVDGRHAARLRPGLDDLQRGRACAHRHEEVGPAVPEAC